MMRTLFFLPLALAVTMTSCSQNNRQQAQSSDVRVGSPCEGCEAIYESPVPFDQLNEIDTLPDFNEPGRKIEINGIIFRKDGKTPAKDVILYVYHTDQQGLYSAKSGDALSQTNWGKRHGYIRGWIKTNDRGEYRIYTLVPASYPNSNNPKHIHPTIKEPGFSEYWIDEFLFDDDPLLTGEEKDRRNAVGGSGLLKTVEGGGILKARRDIILGLNVRNYPGD